MDLISDFTPKSVSFVGLSWLPFSKRGLVMPQIAPTKNSPRNYSSLLSKEMKYQLTQSAFLSELRILYVITEEKCDEI